MTDTTAPLSPHPLSLRQGRFVLEFLKDGNATQAYLRAGYSPRGAQPSASRLLRDPRIEAAVTAGRQRITESLELSVERIAQEYAKMAYSNMGDFVSTDANGRLRFDLDKASEARRAGILELRIRDNSKGEQTVILKLGKAQALAALTKHVGLLVRKPAPGLTAEDRQCYEEQCAGYRRLLDHREQEQERLRRELREAREALAAAEARGPTSGLENPNPSVYPLEREPAEPEPAVVEAHAPEEPPKPAVMPGMPTEPPLDCTPGHLNGKIFWNTDRQAPPGPTWNDIIRRAGRGGFPGR